MYSKEEIREKIKIDLMRHEAFAKKWSNVTRNYKKNGEPFANMQKNFNGADIRTKTYSTHSFEKEASVVVHTSPGGYSHDAINIYETVYCPAERIVKDGYMVLTPDEVWERIQERVKFHKKHIEKCKSDLENLDEEFDAFEKKIGNAVKELKEKMGCHREIIDVVKNRML